MATERLPPVNLIIRDALRGRCGSAAADKPPALALSLTEFDDVRYLLLVDAARPDVFCLSMSLPADPTGATGAQALPKGAVDAVAKTYAQYAAVAAAPAEGYALTLEVTLSKLPPEGEALDAECERVASLRSVVMGVPLREVLSALASGAVASSDLVAVPYRPGEAYYAKRSDAEAVTVVFPMLFKDAADAVIARTFLAQFVEVRRTAALNTAPACSYSLTPPGELKDVKHVAANGGYMSFVVFKRHVASGKKLEAAVWALGTFYAFVAFHIKCSKAYMHTSLRRRTASLLQVLNRAKPEVEKEKKTASGRAFVRKV